MSAVVGIDLSSHAIDLVRLDETDNRAEWLRVTLDGAKAWDRARTIRDRMPPPSWWDNVYLAAVERPFHRHGQDAIRLIQGAAVACVPSSLELWEVRPSEWKGLVGVKLNAKPTHHGLATAIDGLEFAPFTNHGALDLLPQDALDALGVAYYARETNAKGIAA